MTTSAYPHPIFTLCARVRGGFISSFVFQNEEELDEFQNKYLPEVLEPKYGKLAAEVSTLPGLKIGDKCYCLGEGNDVLEVEDIRQIGPYRWSFGLSHGCWEEVAKCWKKVS